MDAGEQCATMGFPALKLGWLAGQLVLQILTTSLCLGELNINNIITVGLSHL